MENFFPFDDMKNFQVNHIDGNKANNSLKNLEWVSCKDNIHHAIVTGLRAKENGASTLNSKQVVEIYHRAKQGEKNVDLGKEFRVHPDTIGKIKNKKAWKELLETLND